MPEIHLSPAETAARLGVTVRALRVYERHRLVTPLRTEAGWRTYGPEQLARLHQVLALKRLGLPLARIGELLAGRLSGLDSVLAVQEAALRTRVAEAEHGLLLLAQARRRLAAGVLSLDDLIQLTRETTMTEKLDPQTLKRAMAPYVEKHFTEEDHAKLKSRRADHEGEGDGEMQEVGRLWSEEFLEAQRLAAIGDPSSSEARALAQRWQALEERFSGGDPDLKAKSAAVWREALADPETVPKLGITPEVFAFVREAARLARAS